MALTPCQECGTELSTGAAACPRCGAPRPTAPTTTAERRPRENGSSPFRKPPVPGPSTAGASPGALSHTEQTSVGKTSLSGSRGRTENATDRDRLRRRVLWGLGSVLGVLVLAGIGGARTLLAFAVLIALGVAVTALVKGSLPTLHLTKRMHAVGLLVVALVLLGIFGSLPKSPEEQRRDEILVSAYVACQLAVQDKLKAPSTASFPTFPDEARHNPGGDTAYIISHVDAQNSFGAMIRTRFVCEMKKTGGAWTVDNIAVGN